MKSLIVDGLTEAKLMHLWMFEGGSSVQTFESWMF